jgi:restriction system protein
VLHQIVLRTLYELFEADTAGALNVVIFNGWVEPQAANGTKARRYVMAAKVAKEAFAALNLWDTDSRTCFKALKGVAGSKLHALAPVVPAQTIHQ